MRTAKAVCEVVFLLTLIAGQSLLRANHAAIEQYGSRIRGFLSRRMFV